MLVCSVSARARLTWSVDLDEGAAATDALTTVSAVFDALIDDPASVTDEFDAFLGEIMLEAASAAEVIDAGFSFTAAIVEATTSASSQDATVAGAPATTMNPADKSANVTLSGGNLIVGATTSSDGGVRSTASRTGGKFYFEVGWSGTPGSDSGVGIATGTATLSSMGNTTMGVAQYYPSGGSIYFNGSAVGSLPLGAPANISVAVDLVNSRIWFRKDGGTWNGAVVGDPAANTGGINISALFPANAAFVDVTVNSTTPVATVNFGGSTFTYAMPSGFAAWG